MNKIVILRYLACDESVEYLFSLKNLLNLGYEIEYLNVSAITTKEKGISYKVEGVKYFDIYSYKELKEYIKEQNLKNTIFIPYMIYFAKTYRCFYLLSLYRCTVCYFVTGFFPLVLDKSINQKIKMFIKKPLKVLNSVCLALFVSLLKKTLFIKSADILFYSGLMANLEEYKISNKTLICPFNSADYQRYFLSLTNSDVIFSNRKYMVFIDQYIPFHPDFNIAGYDKIDAERYFNKINSFFSLIETKYNLDIIIAAHPKAEKYKQQNYFEGREVYFGQVNQLIKYSQSVILHFSTALSMAILHNKPCIFISDSLFLKNIPYAHQYIQHFSSILDANYYCLDTVKDVTIKNVCLDKYSKYKNNYLFNIETEEIDNSISISNGINRVLNNIK
ncbi:MAG: hypothetical protein PARBA_00176 [Parabacteroides sp.]